MNRCFSLWMTLALAVALVARPVPVLASTRPLDTQLHDAWSTQDGLPQSAVESLLLSQDGYLWVGSQLGLARFNGASFRVLDHSTTPEMVGDWVTDMEQAADGTLFIGLKGGGVMVLEHGSPAEAATLLGLEGANVVGLAMDSGGVLWIATRDGLFQHDRAHSTGVTPVDLEGVGLLQWLGTTGDERVWVAPRSGGIVPLSAGEPTQADPILADRLVSGVLQMADGSLLVGTNEGLFTVGEGGLSRRYGHGLPDTIEVTSLLEGSDGAIWLGSRSSGLWRLSTRGVERFSHEDGLGVDNVTSLLEDAEGSLWIGTRGGGLNRLRSAAIESHPTAQPWTILEDRDGKLWYGSASGLHRLDERGRNGFPGKHVLQDVVVGSLMQATDGTLWVGSLGDGLYALAGERTIRHVGAADGLPGQRIYSMAEAPDGTIFVGTNAGVARLDGDTAVDITATTKLGTCTIRALGHIASGELWACTDGEGCHQLGPQGFTPVPGSEALTPPQRLATSMVPAADGTVWITTDGGLLRWQEGRFQAFTVQHGMPDEIFYQVIPDADGNLWLGGNKGIYRVAQGDLEAVAAGTAARVEVRHYGHAQGVRWVECNGGNQPSGWRARDGVLWFPTTGGLISIDPERLRPSLRTLPVRFENVRVDGRDVSLASAPVFPPGSRRFEFDYAALTFIGPEQVRYKVMIEGLDQDWVEVGNNRSAYFHTLPPGRYRFRVIAANSDGVWNTEGASFPFELEPALYQRWQFQVLLASLLVLLGLFIPLLRIRELKRREAELEAAVAARTEELRELSLSDPLTGLRNRRYLWEVLANRPGQEGGAEPNRRRALQTDRLGILMIDIDHFKQVNDQHGHPTGDELLRGVAAVLRSGVRAGDIAVRWGGEEFLLAIRSANPDDVLNFAERIRQAVAEVEVQTPAGTPLRCTCSMGVSLYPFPGPGGGTLDLERAIALADAGLYRAKQRGRNRTVQVLPGPELAGASPDALRELDDLAAAQGRGLLRLEEPEGTQERQAGTSSASGSSPGEE